MFEKDLAELAENLLRNKPVKEYCDKNRFEMYALGVTDGYNEGFQKGIKARINTTTISDCPIKDEWHKLDWKTDYPKLDRLVRVRTKYGEEYICETYAYMPSEDEIGYGKVLTQFEELNGDWVDDNEIEYWCYIEPFKENE